MNRIFLFLAIAAAFCSPLCALAAGTPAPIPMPTPHLPDRVLHARLEVEVNSKGQVVRVAHGDLSGDRNFDLVAIGNALQMWIRHPDGTAEAGLYNITYDYNPKTHNVVRKPALIKSGGAWADYPGAATSIIKDAKAQERAAEQRLQAEQMKEEAAKSKSLPDINAAVRRSMNTPAPSPNP